MREIHFQIVWGTDWILILYHKLLMCLGTTQIILSIFVVAIYQFLTRTRSKKNEIFFCHICYYAFVLLAIIIMHLEIFIINDLA